MNIKLSATTKTKLKELAAKMGVTTNEAVIIAIASLHFQEVKSVAVSKPNLKEENHRLAQRITQLEGEPNEVGY